MELPERLAWDLNARLKSDGVIVIVLRVNEEESGCTSTVQMSLTDKRVAKELPSILDQLKADTIKSLTAHELLGNADEHED